MKHAILLPLALTVALPISLPSAWGPTMPNNILPPNLSSDTRSLDWSLKPDDTYSDSSHLSKNRNTKKGWGSDWPGIDPKSDKREILKDDKYPMERANNIPTGKRSGIYLPGAIEDDGNGGGSAERRKRDRIVKEASPDPGDGVMSDAEDSGDVQPDDIIWLRGNGAEGEEPDGTNWD